MKARPIRGYDKLALDERFRLSVRARARGDVDEYHRLQESCERKHYRQADRDYSVPLRDAELFTLAFSIDLMKTLGQIQLMTAVVACDESGFDPHPAFPGLRDRLVRYAVDQMAAFERVGQLYMGLPAVTLVAAFMAPVLDDYKRLTEGCDHHGDADAAHGDELEAAWREAVGR